MNNNQQSKRVRINCIEQSVLNKPFDAYWKWQIKRLYYTIMVHLDYDKMIPNFEKIVIWINQSSQKSRQKIETSKLKNVYKNKCSSVYFNWFSRIQAPNNRIKKIEKHENNYYSMLPNCEKQIYQSIQVPKRVAKKSKQAN